MVILHLKGEYHYQQRYNCQFEKIHLHEEICFICKKWLVHLFNMSYSCTNIWTQKKENYTNREGEIQVCIFFYIKSAQKKMGLWFTPVAFFKKSPLYFV